MDKNEISLRIIGKNGDEPLSPANFDIGQIRFLLDEVENLLYPDKKKRKDRPVISYEMKEGSVINIFRTSLQNVLMFSSMLGAVEQNSGSIDKLEVNSAQALENCKRLLCVIIMTLRLVHLISQDVCSRFLLLLTMFAVKMSWWMWNAIIMES